MLGPTLGSEDSLNFSDATGVLVHFTWIFPCRNPILRGSCPPCRQCHNFTKPRIGTTLGRVWQTIRLKVPLQSIDDNPFYTSFDQAKRTVTLIAPFFLHGLRLVNMIPGPSSSFGDIMDHCSGRCKRGLYPNQKPNRLLVGLVIFH